MGRLWQLKRKLRGIYHEPPTAMMDSFGNLVTSSKALEDLTVQMFTERLKSLPIKEELRVHKVQRENVFNHRIKQAQSNITPDWVMEDLDTVLKQLKTKKSRDPLGLANELFKPVNIGEDLKAAVLTLMNQIKKKQEFQEILKYCNITSLYKHKGSRKDFNNYRGIFRVTVLRTILDKLIYNDEYPKLDENLTDTNVGARKNRNIRDNIFVFNAILNSISKQRLKDTDVALYDVEKCFDKLWAKECLNDIHDHGLQNDKFPLLYMENMNAQVAVKTSEGTSKRMSISDIIMQGTVWGSLLCTSTIDKLGELAQSRPDLLYKYKGVPVPPLGMVDDIISVTNVENTKEVNSLINTFIEKKKLKLSHTKCKRIHIGKGHSTCPILKVHDQDMEEADDEKYLGDIIDKS